MQDISNRKKLSVNQHHINVYGGGIIMNLNASTNSSDKATWRKNAAGIYVDCNQKYAQMAGFNSPAELIGKDDYACGWRDLASDFIAGDRYLIKHALDLDHKERLMSMEKEITPKGDEIDILVCEVPDISEDRSKCIGVKGFFIEANGKTFIQSNRFIESTAQRAFIAMNKVHLREPFDGVVLTKNDVLTAYWLNVLGTYKGVARKFKVTEKAIEMCIYRISLKMQDANSRWEIHQKNNVLLTLKKLGVFDVIAAPDSPFVNEVQLTL
jgi:PAS domain-containing protein